MEQIDDPEIDPMIQSALAKRDRERRFMLITATALAFVTGIIVKTILDAFTADILLNEDRFLLAALTAVYIWSNFIESEAKHASADW